MGLGLLGLLASLQVANPNSSNTSQDSSRAIAERIASYLMENGKRMVERDSISGDYLTCWVKDITHNNFYLRSVLCKTYDSQSPSPKNFWFLELLQTGEGNISKIASDGEVNGDANVCLEVIGEFSPRRIKGKECDDIYRSLLNSVSIYFRKEN